MGKNKLIFLITFSCLFVYLNSIFNPFIWDDISLIVENPYIKNLRFFPDYFKTDIYIKFSNFYRPLQTFSYTIIYKIFKFNPVGYHILNIFLHASCAILIFILLKDIYGEKISFLVSVLWAIHPVNTEAITYISGTADPLFLLFGLLGIYLYNKNLKILSYISFFASLLSKETAVLIFPLFILYQYSTDRLKKESMKDYITIFLIFFIYILLRETILSSGRITTYIPFKSRFFTSFKTFFIYISIFLFPFILSIERHIPYINTWKDIDFIAGFLYFSLFLYFLWIKRKNKKIFFAGILFLLNYLFHSNIFIPLNGNLREHWMYLGSIGFFIYFVLIFERIKKEKLKIILLAFIFSLYGIRTILRNYDWKDPERFYEKSIRYSFYPAQLYGNLCYHFIKNGEFKKGYQLSKKLIDSGLKNESILYVYGLSALNLKKYNEAENSFLEILKLNPKNYEVLTELGDLYFTKGDIEKAKKFLYESLNICKTYPKTYYLFSKIYMIENDIEKVENCVDILIQLVPDDFYPYFLKGVILKQKKEFEKAYENFNKANSILKNKNDYNSLLNLGILYREMGKIDEALKLFSRLINMFSDNIDIMNEIGICYAIKGEKEKAKVIWEKILKKNPNYLPAKENLKRLGF